MPIDPSIELQAGQGVTPLMNPLDMFLRAQEAQRAVNSNKLIQGQIAAGQAFQGSINPDGTTNQNALLQRLKNSPDAASAALETASSGQGLSKAEYDQKMQRLTYLTGAMGGLLSKHGPIDPEDVKATAAQAVKENYASQSDASNFLSGLPSDPNKVPSFLRSHQIQALSAQEALSASMPHVGQVGLGDRVGFVDTNPMTNAGQPGSPGSALGTGISPQFVDTGPSVVPTVGGQQTGPGIQTYPSRAQLGSRVQTGTNQDGSPIFGPMANVTPPNLAGPGALGTGRPPAALLNPANPNSGGVQNSGNVTTGIGPARQAQLATQGGESAKAFQDYSDQGVKAQASNALLGNMLGDTSQFATGPGTAGTKKFKETLTSWAPGIASAFGIDPNSVAANESFDKLTAQILTAQGAGSDARMAVGEAGTPHSGLTPAGVDLIIRQLQGNGDFAQAKAKLAATYPDQSNRAGFDTAVGAKLDPRAFQFARMTPAQKVTYVKGLSDTDRTKVKSAYNFAHENGLLGGP